jgi:SMC interacting uncharacterized protein involved in chromosome segregation
LTDILIPYLEKYFRKLTGNTDIEDSLERLDNLTREEAQMASAELLKMTGSVDDRVKDVQGKVQDVGNMVQAVDDSVQDVGRDVRGDVQDVGNKVQGVEDSIQGIGRDVKDKLDQVNRS